MKLILDIPINSLSFGNVSVNILKELYARQCNVSIFEHGAADLTVFNELKDDFRSWIENGRKFKYYNLDVDVPTLKLWHINGAETRITPNQHLFTFYELDEPTFIEKKILSIQNTVFLSNKEAVDKFTEMGLTNVKYVPLGFDTDFKVLEEDIIEDRVHFILMGKFEKRKRTKEIIQLWLKKYGNDKKYLLSCCVNNQFLNHEQFTAVLASLTNGVNYNNINFLPFIQTNQEFNHFINSADIDLTGLSGAEGWNLPAFNSTALGKWSIVSNHTGHKSWATKENCLLVEPKEKISAEDGIFFAKGDQFNQGNINTFDDDEVIVAMEKAVENYGTVNKEGLKLQEQFTYKNTVDSILESIN